MDGDDDDEAVPDADDVSWSCRFAISVAGVRAALEDSAGENCVCASTICTFCGSCSSRRLGDVWVPREMVEYERGAC